MFVKFTPYLIFYSLLNKTCIFLNISSESVYFSKSFFISFKIPSVLDLIINLMLNSSFNLNPMPLLGPKMSTSLPYFSAIVFNFSLILFMASFSIFRYKCICGHFAYWWKVKHLSVLYFFIVK